MNLKNIITNFLGVLLIGVAIKNGLSSNPSIVLISFLIPAGLALFLFENNKLKEIIIKIITKKFNS